METTLTFTGFEALLRDAAQGCVTIAFALTACWLVAAGFARRGGESEAA